MDHIKNINIYLKKEDDLISGNFAFLAIFYKLYFQPKRQLQSYKNKLQAVGYKVKLFPYKFLGAPLFI